MACITLFAITSGDGDDAARAHNSLRSVRSVAIGTSHRTATSAHELGRGHRQEWHPAAPDAVDAFGKPLRRCRSVFNIPLTGSA